MIRRSRWRIPINSGGGIALLGAFLLFAACSQKPKSEDLARLEESRKAAEAAELRLKELQDKRKALEDELEEQKTLLNQKESEAAKAREELLR